jgi:hypothetical protein
MEVEYKGVKPKHILMKVTSRGRPEQLIKCIRSYVSLANDLKAMTWLISLDTDDNKCNSLGFIDSIRTIIDSPTIVFGGSQNKIHAINRDVNCVKDWDILLCISDDQTPIQRGYDDIIREAMPNDLDHSLWFNDSWQSRINTMEILGRNYYNRDGHIYDNRFKSFYCDNLSTLKAQKRGKLIKSDQCIIKHFHPAAMPELKYDELYDRNQKFWDEDKAMFNKIVSEEYSQ